MFGQGHKARLQWPCRRVDVGYYLVRRGQEDIAIAQVDEQRDAQGGTVPSVKDDAGGPYTSSELDIGQILGGLGWQVGLAVQSEILCL